MIVSFMNMKGGVGKTTLCVHLAGTLAARQKRVLIIDNDPQYNTTQHLMQSPQEYFKLESQNKTLYGVLEPVNQTLSPFQVSISDASIPAPKVKDIKHHLFGIQGGKGCVEAVLGSGRLMYLLLGKTDRVTRPMEDRFFEFVEEAKSQYDFVFIDCHPAASFLSKTALSITECLITPVVLDAYSQRGLALMVEFLDYLKKFSRVKPIQKVVFNLVPWKGRNQVLENSIRSHTQFGQACLNTVIHDSKVLRNIGTADVLSWRRMAEWATKPWAQRVKSEFQALANELFS